jgi:hypothetical protein
VLVSEASADFNSRLSIAPAGIVTSTNRGPAGFAATVGVDDAVAFDDPDDRDADRSADPEVDPEVGPEAGRSVDPEADPDADSDAGTLVAAPLASAAAAPVSGADPPQAPTRNPNTTTDAQFFTFASLGMSFRPRP